MSTSAPEAAPVVRKKYKKTPKIPQTCAVCGAKSLFKYYNVQSCDGCKQFFRRAVVGHKLYYCRRGGKCDLKDTKCRSCRLDWCLFEGMDYAMVVVEKSPSTLAFFEVLNRRRQAVQMRQSEPKTSMEQQSSDFKREEVHDQSSSGEEEEDVDNADNCHPDQLMGQEASRICHSLANSSNNVFQFDATSQLSGGTFSNNSSSATMAPLLDEKSLMISHTLHGMAAFDAALVRFNTRERVFNDGLLEQFQSLDVLLQDAQPCMVTNFDAFTTPHQPIPLPECYKFVEENGNFSKKPCPLIMECISVVDLFRSMPFFSRLDPKDRALLLSYTGLPLVELNARYNSACIHSELVISSASGFTPYFLYCNNKFYSNDTAVQTLAEHIYRKSMVQFNQLKLSREEFWLVRAVMLAHSAATGLSRHAQTLLQAEAERYAGILMHFLQAHYGHFHGAKRYADILSLAESVFRLGEKHREFFTYLAMVTDQGRFHASMPRALVPMILGPPE